MAVTAFILVRVGSGVFIDREKGFIITVSAANLFTLKMFPVNRAARQRVARRAAAQCGRRLPQLHLQDPQGHCGKNGGRHGAPLPSGRIISQSVACLNDPDDMHTSPQ